MPSVVWCRVIALESGGGSMGAAGFEVSPAAFSIKLRPPPFLDIHLRDARPFVDPESDRLGCNIGRIGFGHILAVVTLCGLASILPLPSARRLSGH